MKKIYAFYLVALLGVTTAFAQSSVTLTFLCQTTDGGYLQPDSIIIENLTRNWSETIYYPDTVYTLNVGTSVPNYPNDNGMQVMPNPFDGTTRVNIQSQRTENVKMKLTDMLGRVCAEYNGVLQEDGNLFNITLATPQTYVLSVQTSSGIRSLKMENVGHAGTNRIAYEGATVDKMPVVQLKSNSSHAFELGDEMRFTLYAYLNDTLVAHQTVTQIQNTDGNVIATFPMITDTLNMSFCQVSSFKSNETGFDDKLSHVQDYDGNQYQVVQIGNQCWMKENMKVTHFKDGTTIPLNTWGTISTNPYRNAPYDDENNIPLYGYLYNWLAVMHNSAGSDGDPSGVQGICPTGWHVPSTSEMSKLPLDAKALADSLFWAVSSVSGSPGNDPSSNNASGFSLRPAGMHSGIYYNDNNPGRLSYLWSTGEDFEGESYSIGLSYNSTRRSSYSNPRYYGNSVRCVRDDLRAEIVIDSITIVSDSSVAVRVKILSSHGFPVTSVTVHVNAGLGLNDYYSAQGDNGSGYYYVNIDGIRSGIPYSIQPLAYSSAGQVYGKSIKFSIPNAFDTYPCSGTPTVMDYDGNVYNTVQIGSQCWMSENLRTTHYSEGTPIALGDTYNAQTAYRYYPNNDSALTLTYGYLYNWMAVMNGASESSGIPSGVQGICPTGWHVPSNSEWESLRRYILWQNEYACENDQASIAKALAHPTGWNINAITCTPGNNPEYNNTTNFGIRPAGCYVYGLSGPTNVGYSAFFWNTVKSAPYGLSADNPYFHKALSSSLGDGRSVRCVKD